MRIRTTYDPKPIPVRDFDWAAIDEDTYDGAPDSGPRAHIVGYGATEEEAVEELKILTQDYEEGP